ncbi:MAG: LCP family protein [Vampirovibrionales bacterium]|nr:LCP family protein [Vampirovibrionales bacterium]
MASSGNLPPSAPSSNSAESARGQTAETPGGNFTGTYKPGQFGPTGVSPTKKKPTRRGPWWELGLLGVLGAVLIALLAQFVLQSGEPLSKNLASFKLPGLPVGELKEDIVLLVMGVDAGNRMGEQAHANLFEGARADTLLLVRINPEQKTVGMVSIPRDSKVYLPGGSFSEGGTRVDKINAAHAIGGADLAKQTVENAFGVPVDSTLVINFSGVQQVVDALGGLDIFVEKRMRYHDFSGKLHIDFEPGLQHMNGTQAEAYLRFRHDTLGDIGRVQRQQYFLAALLKKLKQPAALAQLPELIKASQSSLKTDLSFDQLLKIGMFAKHITPASIRTATLPGRPSAGQAISYWIIDPEGARLVLDHVILGTAIADMPPPLTEDGKPQWRLGVFYDPLLAEQLPDIVTQMEQAGYAVTCKHQRKGLQTGIIEHQVASSLQDLKPLRAVMPALKETRLMFAPPQDTYDNLPCGSNEDFTVMLGPSVAK